MAFPAITLTYLAVLSLLYAGLALVVVALRAKHDIPFGDGGNEALGEPRLHVHVMMGALLIARILHPIAFASKLESLPYFVGRITGALTSWAVLSVAAVLLLLRL